MLIPRDFYIVLTVLLLGFVFGIALLAAFYVNLVTKTVLWRHLVSTALITMVAFWLPNIIGNFVLPPVSFFNGVPQDFRSALWDNIVYVCAFTAVLTFIAWQLIARRGNCRFPI
jgi:hypothetical protein